MTINIKKSIKKVQKNTKKVQKNSVILPNTCSFLITTSLVVVFSLHLIAVVYLPYLNHDVAAYLTAGQMIVGGARPYVDIIDTNFPMIMYINAIPAGFSSLTHVPLAVSGILFLFCTTLFTMLLFGKISKITFPELTRQQIRFVYIVWLYCSFFIYYRLNFGEREQLIFLFIAPFVVLRHARYIQVRIPLYLSIPIAFIAFCGVGIKPFYVLPILAIELLHALAYRRFFKPLMSPETGVFALSAIVYMTHFYMFSGMAAFYNYWLGFMMRGYIRGGAYAIGTEETIRSLKQLPYLQAYCAAAVFLSALFLYDRSTLFLLSTCFGWFACFSLAFFIWQQKGWPYHLLTFYYGCCMGVTFLFLACKKFFDKIKDAYMPLLAFLSVFLMLTFCPKPFSVLRAAFVDAPFHFEKNELAKTIESLTEPNDGVLFLDTSTGPGFPALTYTGRKLGGRFTTTWPLAFFFKDSHDYVPKNELREEEARFYEMIERDIDVFRPKLIFVRTGTLQATDEYFMLHEYLRRKGFLKKISSSYQYMGMVKNSEFAFGLVENSQFELWRYNGGDVTPKN